jgi:hypothetical protein
MSNGGNLQQVQILLRSLSQSSSCTNVFAIRMLKLHALLKTGEEDIAYAPLRFLDHARRRRVPRDRTTALAYFQNDCPRPDEHLSRDFLLAWRNAHDVCAVTVVVGRCPRSKTKLFQVDFLAGQLSSSPRWIAVSSLTRQQMLRARGPAREPCHDECLTEVAKPFGVGPVFDPVHESAQRSASRQSRTPVVRASVRLCHQNREEDMKQNRSIAAAVVLAGCLIASAGAQTPSAGQAAGTAAPVVTVPAGSLQKAENAWRGRMLIGTSVFNDNGQRIATIDDLLITDDGRVDRVVLTVTRRQLVAVPFSQFRFVPSQSIPTPGRREPLRRWTRIAANAAGPFGVLLPGASRDSLVGMEPFRFTPPP